MKSGVLVVVAMCLSCAAPEQGAPREYRQAPALPVAPPRPAPSPVPGNPGFNPIEDAPHTFGRPEREYPKSPYARVLPQDEKTRKGPGIWSAVEIASTDEYDPIVILGKERLLPSDLNAREVLWVSECALATRNTFALVASGEGAYEKVQKSIKQFGQDGRCIVARFYRTCISNVDNNDRENKKQLIREGRLQRPSMDRTLRLAKELVDRECDKTRPLNERSERFLNAAIRFLRQYVDKATKEATP